MRDEYDFSQGKRGAVIPSPGKTRITIMLDNDVIESFRTRAEAAGRGYQTAINEALRAATSADNAPLTVSTLRSELQKALKPRAVRNPRVAPKKSRVLDPRSRTHAGARKA